MSPAAEPATAPAPISVVVAAHHPAIRSSLCGVLAAEPGFAPAVAAAELRPAIRLLQATAPDVVLVDRALLGPAGLRRLSMLRAAAPGATLLLVGMGDHPGYGHRAREAGAGGYVRLDVAPEVLIASVRAAASAGHH